MKEIILLYHIDDKIKSIIQTIMDQLDVKVKIIQDNQVNETMGYLLDIPGYEEDTKKEFQETLDKEFVFFAGFSDDQLDMILEIFKAADIPYFPYKAMLTNDNITYRFYQLYQNVEQEYLQLTQGPKSNKEES